MSRTQRQIYTAKCMRNHSAPEGKPRGAKQPLGQSTASLQSRKSARVRSDQATSKWRTTLRDHKIVQNRDDSWSVVHWDGTFWVGTFDEVMSVATAMRDHDCILHCAAINYCGFTV